MKPEIIISGTPYKDWLRCQRLRWWAHEAPSGPDGQRGWERVRMAIPLSTGGWCHAVAQGLLALAAGLDMSGWLKEVGLEGQQGVTSPSEVISAARAGYLSEVALRGLDAEGTPLDETRVAHEQAALLEAFGWAFERVRVPALLARYRVLSVEREEFTMLSGDVGLQGRVDAVLEDRADGNIFTWNLKTVSQPDDRWRAQWEVDQQIILEGLAIERRLGKKLTGALVEGFVKGPRVGANDDLKEVRNGGEATQTIQRNRLLYGYKLDGNPPIQKADYDWEGTTRKGWHKFRVWEEQFPSVQGTIKGLSVSGGPVPKVDLAISPLAYWINWLPEEVVVAQFELLEPIIRSDRAVESFTRQIVKQEQAIRTRRLIVENSEESEADLDAYFPQDFHSCVYPGKCSMYAMCHEPGVSDDPAGSGLYQIKTLNHPQEVD